MPLLIFMAKIKWIAGNSLQISKNKVFILGISTQNQNKSSCAKNKNFILKICKSLLLILDNLGIFCLFKKKNHNILL
jgi:hypothetical protein